MIYRNILVVDDEPLQIRLMEKFIIDMGYNVITMDKGQDAVDFFIGKKTVENVKSSEVAVMLLDLSMPDVDGLTVMKKIANVKGDLQVIVLTASSEISFAISAINLGAVDYIVKGEKDLFARLTTSINSAIEKRTLQQQVYSLERKNFHQVSFSDLIGSSPNFLATINLAKKASNSNVPILIDGESGTGKEMLARAIHGSGSKSGKPFIVVDCDILKQDSDQFLFGSEKSVGKVKEADGGTLFLKNIHSLNQSSQIKLLRFIQEGEIDQEGRPTVKASVRIISSTNVDLDGYVRHRRFREDLFYCINIFPITLPSLRERGIDDIKTLSLSFCRDFSVSENKTIKGISDDAMTMIYQFDWEDNIRQLRSYIFRAVMLCDSDMLKPEHFPQIINFESFNKLKLKPKEFPKKLSIVDLFDEEGKCKDLEALETEIFTKLLECFNNNLTEVSKKLKVGRSTIYRKLKSEEKNLEEKVDDEKN